MLEAFDYVEMKNLCTSKETINKYKGEPENSWKGLQCRVVSRIYKEFLQMSMKDTLNSNGKMGKVRIGNSPKQTQNTWKDLNLTKNWGERGQIRWQWCAPSSDWPKMKNSGNVSSCEPWEAGRSVCPWQACIGATRVGSRGLTRAIGWTVSPAPKFICWSSKAQYLRTGQCLEIVL